jgi:hypothetical protein
MHHNLAPPWGVESAAVALPSLQLVIAVGLVAAVLLVIATVCLVSVLSVTSQAGDQRADGIKVLQELGRILRMLLDALRGRRGDADLGRPRGPEDQAPNVVEDQAAEQADGDVDQDAATG